MLILECMFSLPCYSDCSAWYLQLLIYYIDNDTFFVTWFSKHDIHLETLDISIPNTFLLNVIQIFMQWHCNGILTSINTLRIQFAYTASIEWECLLVIWLSVSHIICYPFQHKEIDKMDTHREYNAFELSKDRWDTSFRHIPVVSVIRVKCVKLEHKFYCHLKRFTVKVLVV